MEEIYERIVKMKSEILDLLEQRININASNEELLLISKIMQEVADDKMFYTTAISKLYGGGMALGFNGSANSNTTVNNGEIAESQSV